MKKILVGREQEKKVLTKALQSDESEMISVIGRRRVGKTFLIKSVYANQIDFEITGIQNAPKIEQLLNFKIRLLKTALGKKATLLEIPDQDLMQMVEVLHHISLREQLHIMTLSHSEKNNEHMLRIFGINPLFALKSTPSPLLKKLDAIGTLFIKNIHFLSLETQKYLAEYIRYGHYRPYKSKDKTICNVRIIVSTDQDLLNMVHNTLFSHELYNELKKAKLTMPPLNTLPEQELTNLAEGITEQALQSQDSKPILELTPYEKTKLTDN